MQPLIKSLSEETLVPPRFIQRKTYNESAQHCCTARELQFDESETHLCTLTAALFLPALAPLRRPHTLSYPLTGQVTRVWIIWVTMAGSDPCFVQGFANNPQFPQRISVSQVPTDVSGNKISLIQWVWCYCNASLFSFLETGRSARVETHSKPNEIWGHFIEIRSCHSADGKFPRRDLLYDGEFNLFHHKCSSEELPRHNEMHNRHSESSLGLKKKKHIWFNIQLSGRTSQRWSFVCCLFFLYQPWTLDW